MPSGIQSQRQPAAASSTPWRSVQVYMECVYEQADVTTQSYELENIPDGMQLLRYDERTGINILPAVHADTTSATSQPCLERPNSPPRSEAPHQQRAEDATSNSSLAASVAALKTTGLLRPQSTRLIDWSSLSIQKDNANDTESLFPGTRSDLEVDSMTPRAADEQTEKYHAIYFTHFHHRWPVIHRPPYDRRPCDPVLKLSINMVGAWIDNSQESKSYALATHNYLISYISLTLWSTQNKKSSSDGFQNGLPGAICVSAILNIVFALYCGEERLVFKAVILRTILVAVLREVGFFKVETIMADDRPGYFLPLHLSLQGERQRVAAYLFRIDNYLSIIRDQPTVLMLEELHFTVPVTLAGWDAESLLALESRMAMEPRFRSEKSMSSLIRNATSHSSSSTDDLILVEDVQLCLSAMQGNIRHFWETSRAHNLDEAAEAARDSLKQRLDKLKSRLDQMSSQDTDSAKFGEEPQLPMRYYYGYEDHSKPGWQRIVSQRPKALISDTLMLFHLLNLHLYSDVRTLSRVAKDRATANPPALSEHHQRAQELRIDSARYWTTTAAARRTLSHAVHILLLHQSLTPIWDMRSGALDPISYVALSTSALLIWTFCNFNGPQNPGCPYPLMPAYGCPTTSSMDILSLCCQPQSESQMEFWIDTGGRSFVEIDGVELCWRNVDVLVGRFKARIPDEWELAGIIAPGIL
ncbi:uncharacterized protein BP5553_00931 [Venustampulla echinocandica]|uniref:Uncharacterized protein n=1 Tax=Venustampulla echinocandica TaxID=2656787 RepID=A0A370TZJ3_9HELO|nr:uncharacterized protein BP5553_00931 [Venustampulla echinocandica]RDL40952.1 hypothetical protein BP5553_00931 [Venustampulla echinocandica]